MRSVAEALIDDSWTQDIQGSLSMEGTIELFRLWDCLMNIDLDDNEDQYIWRLDATGCYSSKSAYKAYYTGAITFEPWRQLWKSWAPPKCKMFLWLAIRNRCWTADRLAKRGLDHPEKCPLWDQKEETMQHLLTSFVVARQVWFALLNMLQLGTAVPQHNERNFADWWRRTIKSPPMEQRKGLNSLIILAAWEIWKHRNDCVFEGTSPSVNTILDAIRDEHGLWCGAGARKLMDLNLTLTWSGA
ncbi:hypothetical protein PR202_gb04939 [Eleusine coracana subsp. coracana]|uniref:Reverse transcriptase zinc-binding domain-containing protein n=1 Tax=Eleusine coracana subsp. coracana TaxID=191504 RepID=A0AAV5E4X9_ELECO|nr:hypothetical protein PR202_gb04939 [Eleusine coracana subsp. coracana]